MSGIRSARCRCAIQIEQPHDRGASKQFHDVAGPHLPHHVAAMHLHGSGRSMQRQGNLPIVLAFQDQMEDPQFRLGQGVVVAGRRRWFWPSRD